MPKERFEAEPDRRILVELSALADGTLEPGRAVELRGLIAASPTLAARYERERRAVLALQSLSVDRAPASLRVAIDSRTRVAIDSRSHATIDSRPHPMKRHRGRLMYGGALAASIAAVVALLVLLLPGGSPGAPAVSQAAALALRGPALAAPATEGDRLAVVVGQLYFPNWAGSFHWRAVGQRTDQLDGKLAVTVYYQRAGKRIAYTILAAPPLGSPGGRTLYRRGIRIETFTMHGRLVATWRRGGHTCVLSGAGVGVAELARLAGWRA